MIDLSLDQKVLFLKQKLEEALSHLDDMSEWQGKVRAAYRHWGGPRSEDKSETFSVEVKSLGGQIDGLAGRIFPGRSRTLENIDFTFDSVCTKQVSLKRMQILAGKHGHRFQFRKETSTCFSEVWKEITLWGKAKPMPPAVPPPPAPSSHR